MESVNAISAFHLKNHLDSLQAAFDVLPNGREDQQQYRAAYKQVEQYLSDIKDEIGRTDVRWVTARGYLRVWNLTHREWVTPNEDGFNDRQYSTDGSPLRVVFSVLTLPQKLML